jgi:hypothetical protein
MVEYNGATVRDYSLDSPLTSKAAMDAAYGTPKLNTADLRTTLKFQGSAPAVTQTGTPIAAIDAATTQALVNDLRAKLIALGIIS